MRFDITAVSNGTLVEASYLHTEDADTEQYVSQSIEDTPTRAFAEMLRVLVDNYAPMSSRYSEERIYILVRPGDKHDDFTNELF